MQSPLFGYTEHQSQDRYALQNPQLLRVALTGHDDVLARKGAMVAYQGLIEFDGEYQTHGQRRARARTGEGLDLMRCSGPGHGLPRQPRPVRPCAWTSTTRA